MDGFGAEAAAFAADNSDTPATAASTPGDKVSPMLVIRYKESLMSDSIISVEHVFKSVTDSTGTLDILRDIDFALNARETVAIVGASGSGKSTLLSIIAGLGYAQPRHGAAGRAGPVRHE